MSEQKRIEKTTYTVFLLIFGALFLICSALYALMYPSLPNHAWGILAVGVVLTVLSVIMNPSLIRDVFINRRSLLWINDICLVLAIIGIGVMLTYISARRHYKWDLTRDRLFSLSDSTIKQLQLLKKDIKITAFFGTGTIEGQMVNDLLSEYKRYSEKLTFKMVDPFRDPLTTKGLNIRSPNTIVVQCDTNRKDIFDEEIFMRPNPYMRQTEKPKFMGEQSLTSALITVTQGTKRKVMFVKGHEELSITTFQQNGIVGFQKYLEKENFDVTEGTLLETIASDVSIIAIMSPKKAFSPSEIVALKQFISEQKGKLLVSLDPECKVPDLEKFLSEAYGITFNNEVIINPRSQNPVIIIPQYEAHPIVKDQAERKIGLLMQMARGLSLSVDNHPEWKAVPFLRTDGNSFAKRNMEELYGGNTQFNANTDVRGPVTVGVAFEGTGLASGSRAVFFGDADFASNMLIQVQGNADLVVNTVNWLAGQEQNISIRPKTLDFAQVDIEKLDREAQTRILLMTVVVAPLFVVFVGGLVWFTRRRI
jgi:ABC-type uncharacterized transport system involved in gliding motility auxiliary subunit